MLVRDVMTPAVLTVGPAHTVRQVARQMAARRVGAAVVHDPDSEGPGILTERDVLEVAKRRWPAVRFRVAHATVQGPRAAAEVMGALAALDQDDEVDVVVIARGGGSVEDLLPFSDEGLLRAVAKARTPVVSAIGHEPDQPLLDLVADIRAAVAATPLPEGTFITLGGQFQAQEEASRLIGVLSLVSLALMAVVLYSRYRSMVLSALIMANIPLALVGAVLGLWLSGQPLSIAALVGFITANVPAGDYLVIGGDMNSDTRTEPAITTLGQVVRATGPFPVDQAGDGDTNANRNSPYDWVMLDNDLNARAVPVTIGAASFPNGLVFDSRVYTPLTDVSPVLIGDSGAVAMQHMAVVKDVLLPAQ